MDDFAEAKKLIEDAGGGIQVENKKELAEKVIFFLKNRKEAENIGKKAQRALTKNTGAAEKHAKVIYEFLA
jgi:3-deoxy-D-manno-octulosonic-acid transferase